MHLQRKAPLAPSTHERLTKTGNLSRKFLETTAQLSVRRARRQDSGSESSLAASQSCCSCQPTSGRRECSLNAMSFRFYREIPSTSLDQNLQLLRISSTHKIRVNAPERGSLEPRHSNIQRPNSFFNTLCPGQSDVSPACTVTARF